MDLAEIGEAVLENPITNQVDEKSPDEYKMAYIIANMLKKDKDADDADTKDWKSKVPEWLHEFGDVFSKKKSE
jgi:hypothetical protein